MAEPTPRAAAPRLTAPEIQALLDETISLAGGLRLVTAEAEAFTFAVQSAALPCRQGGTVSGPALFAAMDVAAYVTVNGLVGHVPAATLSSCSVDFLEAVQPAPLTVEVRPLRIGMRTAVLAARVTDASGLLIAVATLHFAVPVRPARAARATAAASATG